MVRIKRTPLDESYIFFNSILSHQKTGAKRDEENHKYIRDDNNPIIFTAKFEFIARILW